MKNSNYLSDKDFLKELDNYPHRELYAKLISLSFDEEPMEEIQGRITQGSINLNGSSAVRRTCNITLLTEDVNINNFYWGLNTKFSVYIGIVNNINKNYPDIIWIPEGIFVISTFSESLNNNSHTISITGKDKMCLLNGENGGTVHSLSWDFGTIDEKQDDGSILNKDLKLQTIVREAVHEYAHEPYENIIINDLDELGIELMEYRGKNPLYFYINADSRECEQVTTQKTNLVSPCAYNPDSKFYEPIETVNISDLESKGYYYDTCVNLDSQDITHEPTLVAFADDPIGYYKRSELYTIAKVEYGMTAGYRTTDLTYAGDLILSVGEPVTSMLDKIVAMLGNYEYYYDTQGHFIFQRKKTYVNTSFNNIVNNKDELYVESAKDTSAVQYSFIDNILISSFQNSPNLANLKNDYSLWGKRKNASGSEIPVHIRYAIDKKPLYYKNYAGKEFFAREEDAIKRRQELYDEIVNYKKKLNPIGLPEPQRLDDGTYGPGWWNVRDWAEFYKSIKEEYPNDTLETYLKSPMHRPSFNLNDIFPVPDKTKTGGYNYGGGVAKPSNASPTGWIAQNNPTYAFGVMRDNVEVLVLFDVNSDNSLGFYGHHYKDSSLSDVVTCSHRYTDYFVNANIRNNSESYIYNPEIPEFDESIKQALKDRARFVDWREIIYQMALDYNKYALPESSDNDVDFLLKIKENNGKDENGYWKYEGGITGYEQYYADITGFWRQLYCPANEYREYVLSKGEFNKAKAGQYYVYKNGKYKDIVSYGRLYNTLETYYVKGFTNSWNDEVIEHPETINFWIDFLDSDADMAKYNVHSIGSRTKALNDDNIKAIYFRETPTVIFFDPTKSETLERKPGYTYIQAPAYMDSLFEMSTQGKSAKDELDNALYNFAYCTETISINALPVYYLEPNIRIFVEDSTSGINGEYIISTITLPLSYNGNMSISATKAPERLY